MYYWLFKLLLRSLATAFFDYRVVGAEKRIEGGGAIIASNHASFMDPPLVGVGYEGDLFYLARSTLFKGPFAWLLPKLNAVPVDRDAADLKSMKTIIRTLKDGKPVLMFPEGTRSPDGKLQEAKPGVGMLIAKGGVPVQPVRVVGSFEALPRSGGVQFHPVTVFIGDPLEFDPTEFRGREGYQQIADRVMEAIGELGESPSEATPD
jgi:1-acyl-sn-glycerol-3-phosphate acyltransferase